MTTRGLENAHQGRAMVDMHHTEAPKFTSVRLTLQPEQRLIVTDDPDGHLFIVNSGVLMLEAKITPDQRRVLELLFAGDVFPTADAPRLPGTLLVAANACELMRFRPSVVEGAYRSEPELNARIQSAIAHRNARRTLHLASLAEPNAEVRLADFLVEIGLYLGAPAGRSNCRSRGSTSRRIWRLIRTR